MIDLIKLLSLKVPAAGAAKVGNIGEPPDNAAIGEARAGGLVALARH